MATARSLRRPRTNAASAPALARRPGSVPARAAAIERERTIPSEAVGSEDVFRNVGRLVRGRRVVEKLEEHPDPAARMCDEAHIPHPRERAGELAASRRGVLARPGLLRPVPM